MFSSKLIICRRYRRASGSATATADWLKHPSFNRQHYSPPDLDDTLNPKSSISIESKYVVPAPKQERQKAFAIEYSNVNSSVYPFIQNKNKEHQNPIHRGQ
jgi:hypothetical protein